MSASPSTDSAAAVVRHLLERRHAVARQGTRVDDGRKIGLVVQGGCMRGVFTAGALCGLEELGLRSGFDVVYGASGGAINAAYFLARQVAYGTSIYYSDINRRAFIDFTRIFGGTAVDIDYCFDEVIARRKRLSLDNILASPSAFKIFVTDPETCHPTAFVQHDLASPAELFAVLKASAAMPFVYRRPVLVRGKQYTDGAFFEPVPLHAALADGCTDVLVILSKPLEVDHPPMGRWLRELIYRSINPTATDELEATWRAAQERLDRAHELLRRGLPVRNGDGTVNLACIAPPLDFPVVRWTKDRRLLVDAAIEGASRACERFGIDRGELQPHEAVRLRA